MFAALRSLAPAILLVALLAGQASTGFLLAHVTGQHLTPGPAGHPDADHHAAEHASEPGAPSHAEHDDGHSHQFVPATAATTARVAGPSQDLRPCLAIVGPDRSVRAVLSVRLGAAPPGPVAGPPEPQRHPILLL